MKNRKTMLMSVIVMGMLALSASAYAHQRMLGINSAGNLYEIDPASGDAIFLGDTGIPGTITSMTADPAGTLWVINTQNGKAMLFSIPFGDVVAGAGTQISLAASPFTDYTWIQGMSFDNTGTVLLATGNRADTLPTPNELITIATSGATATPRGSFASPAFPCIEDVDALAMSSTGALFGWDSDGFACFGNLHRFLSIDPVNGVATPVGAAYPFSTSIFALQFDQSNTLYGARHPGNAGGPATLVTMTETGIINNIGLIVDESATVVNTVVGLAFADVACTNPCPTDINGDGVTDTADLGLLISAFGNPCPLAP